MSKLIPVRLGPRSYAIHLGAGLLEALGPLARESVRGRNGLVVSDGHVQPLYGARAADSLRSAGFTVSAAVVPPGEASKSSAQLLALYDATLRAGLDRSGCIVALGGGVVGDLAGFLAATYLRGVALVQVPTTLLAMVDSSVGGKTGINLPAGKNLVGAFHQPALVVADINTLRTLPDREVRAGLAAVVKVGAIRDAVLFQTLESAAGGLARPWKTRTAAERDRMEEIIARGCEIKAEIVAGDEREESGLRALLNFGHTFGHAVEQVAGYGTYLHGEAVAIGMAFAARLSARLAGLPPAEADRLIGLLRGLGLPVAAQGLAWPELRAAMGVDKKAQAHAPRFVLLGRLGAAVAGCAVPEADLEAAFRSVNPKSE
ncbi:MAG: 3-dehydroquinate synthase [Kiritimatiellaeota bacterium]|nr:3-dehydroquinate synthase [Kiritimatiellota bacterium]